MAFSFPRLLEYVRDSLIEALTVKQDRVDKLEASEGWFEELDGVLRKKHTHPASIRDLGRKGISDQLRGKVARELKNNIHTF